MALEYLKNIVTAPARLGAKLPEIGERIGEFVGNEIYGTGLTADGEKTGRMLSPNSMAASPMATPVPMLGNTPQVAPGVSSTPTPQAQQLSQPQALGGVPVQPAPNSPQANFEAKVAAEGPLSAEDISRANEYAASIGTTFDPETGYDRTPFLRSQESAPVPASNSGLTTVGGTPLAQFLSGAAIPEAGLAAERQLAGRGETLTPEQFNQLSAEREQRAMESFGEARGPDSRGLSIRDANGMTQGDRRNIERAKGIGGSAQINRAQQMGNQANAEAAQAEQVQAPKPTAEQRKVNLIKQGNPSITDEQASAIAAGTIKVNQNPLTGETQLLNIATGETTKVGEDQVEAPQFEVAQPEEGLFSRAGKFTGAVEAVKRKAQGLTGQAGVNVATDESLEAAQDFETAQNELVRAFRESDRYSATEANQLKKELNISLSPFEDPKSAEAKLRSIDESLSRRYENEIATYQDASFPSKDRQDARLRARAIAQFRAVLGVPQEPSSENSSGQMSAEEIANIYL
jgi:hypothetical protein